MNAEIGAGSLEISKPEHPLSVTCNQRSSSEGFLGCKLLASVKFESKTILIGKDDGDRGPRLFVPTLVQKKNQ